MEKESSNFEVVYIIIAAVLIVAGFIGAVFFVNNSKAKNNTETKMDNTQTNNKAYSSDSTPFPTVILSSNTGQFSDLIKEDVVLGKGKEATAGKTIVVNYTGKLLDGTIFDSSLKPGREPFEFQLGAGQVIEGWDQGFDGMKEGGKRLLKIPSDMAYGPYGAGGIIKPNYDLVFEVELLEVK